MKRNFLEDLGLEEDVIVKIMAENGKDIKSLKTENANLKEDISVKEGIIETKNTKIAELEKVDVEAIKKEQFELGRMEGSKEIEEFKRQNAIDKEYSKEFEIDGKKYKVKDRKGLQGYIDNEKIKYENNEVSGLVEQFPEIVKTSPYLFETDTKNPQFADTTQGTTNKELTKEAFKKMTYKERVALKNEKPEVYENLKNE